MYGPREQTGAMVLYGIKVGSQGQINDVNVAVKSPRNVPLVRNFGTSVLRES